MNAEGVIDMMGERLRATAPALMPLEQEVEMEVPQAPEMREIVGLKFWDIDLDRAARFLVNKAIAGDKVKVYFVNAHCVNVAAHNLSYRNLLERAPFLFADGIGLSIAARMFGFTLRNNVNGTDLFPKICEAAAAAGVPIAFLGARCGVALKCARLMERKYPGLRVAWVEDGFLSGNEEQRRLQALNRSGAGILFVAKGVPTQEVWIDAHAPRLAPPVVLGVGAMLDFYSGSIRRAPRFVRAMRMEWSWRLLCEPRRLFRRYVFGIPTFLARVVCWRLFRSHDRP
ncbi:MAG: WecB/TagA/CpsF family glycosyltransferase [Steroidobacteraceae bacterium]